MTNPETLVTFSAPVMTASSDTRTITGQIVPFGAVGQTSLGPVIFELGSIRDINPAEVKLLLQHDGTRPIGKMTDFTITPGGINASFKIALTSAGTDSLIEASQGLRDGLSVGASIIDSIQKDDGIHVLSARLIEVSLVTEPAFAEARVSQVAAVADTSTQSIEEIEMSNETPEAVEAEVVEVVAPVEASKVVAQGSPIFSAPRSPIVNAASYLEHSIKAAKGNEDSRQFVMAADDSTSTNTGWTLSQPNPFNEFISSTFSGRPAVDAVSRQALTSAGMSFTIPRLTTAPTVAVTAEGAAPSETGMVSDYITVDVKKASGYNEVSFELAERSSPEFMAELMSQLTSAYAKATDNAVIAALAAGTQGATVAATAAGLQSFIATESAAAFKATSGYARNLVASTDQWAAIMGYADSTGRPLYTAEAVQNAPGATSGQSITGSVLGTNLYVDPNITVSGLIDDSAYLVVPEAVTFYEGAQTRLQVNLLSTGQIGINLYGYYAIATKKAAGIRRYNVA